MQVKAPRLRALSDAELRLIEEFARSIGVKPRAVALNPHALEVPGGAYLDVFDLPTALIRIIEDLRFVYAGGYYVGSLAKSKFVPGLPLAQRLSRLCGLGLRCILLDLYGAKRFLYGERVTNEHVVRFSEGLAVVVDSQGEAIGWGIGRRVRLKTKVEVRVEPVKDLGWYLRRGG